MSARPSLRWLTASALCLLGLSGNALAHNPMCECKQIDNEQIRCTGGFRRQWCAGRDPRRDRL